ncbi:MAG: hypothetical protein J0L82_02165 [Deltaproteobacteria bacterium]|jgi:diaminopimelate decarboxylase|nr:hypothetical protein [Deltaproteobacteria bacterium]
MWTGKSIVSFQIHEKRGINVASALKIEKNITSKIIEIASREPEDFFLYSLDAIERNALKLNRAVGPDVQVFYSLKCNSAPEIVRRLNSLGMAFDVSSREELEICLRANCKPAAISFIGPGKTSEDIKFALKKNIGYLVVESLEELKEVMKFNEKTEVLLRLSRRPDAQFGIDLDECSNEERDFILKNTNGFHCHVRSQSLSATDLIETFRDSLSICSVKKADTSYINLGGGFGVPYFETDSPFDLRKFSSLFRSVKASMPFRAKPTLFCESGRYIAANAGFYVMKVLYVKRISGRTVVITNGGLHHFMAATRAGQFMHRSFPIFPIRSKSRTKANKERMMICGKTCSEADVFAADVHWPRVGPGDLIVVGSAGAYSQQYSPTGFIFQKRAKEYYI